MGVETINGRPGLCMAGWS